MEPYQSVKALYAELPAFQPLVPTGTLPTIAFVCLVAAFALIFFLTTLPKTSLHPTELPFALFAAILAGAGTVALFNSVGVYV